MYRKIQIIPLDDSRLNKYYKSVAGKLQAEIKQTRPFESIEEEAVLNVLRTAELIQGFIAGFLKEFELSPVQYNVLRILRGAGETGATCSQIGERLLTRDPDITRLLDRLEARGLVQRERSSRDRRAVVTKISAAGLTLVASIDQPLRRVNQAKLAGFGRDALANLTSELERLRSAFETEDTQKTESERKTK
jgi:DNA-binding MarR family transcriptional regulator